MTIQELRERLVLIRNKLAHLSGDISLPEEVIECGAMVNDLLEGLDQLER